VPSCLILRKPHGATLEPESRAVTTRHFGKVWRSTPARLIPGRPNVIQLSVCDDVCPPSKCVLSHCRALFSNYMFITPLNPTRTDIMPCPPTCQPIHLEEFTLVPQLTSFDAVLLTITAISALSTSIALQSHLKRRLHTSSI
jgi:hypothetical protein